MFPENIYPKLGYEEAYTILSIIVRSNNRQRGERTIIHESFFTVSKHFSNHRPLTQPLFAAALFWGEICIDHHKCGTDLQYVLESYSDQAVMWVTEYEGLLRCLDP